MGKSLGFDHALMGSNPGNVNFPLHTIGTDINFCVPSAFGKPGRIGPTQSVGAPRAAPERGEPSFVLTVSVTVKALCLVLQ